MRGILRPCRGHLGPALARRWQAHLCGLCLTLRDVAGQPERVLTGYDVLLLSVLVEAQAGRVGTAVAGPCPLRGLRPATVVSSRDPAAHLAAAGALLSGGAGLVDKLADGDLPRGTRAPARRVAARLVERGRAAAARVGLDPSAVLSAPGAAMAAERRPEDGLAALLAPAGAAVASLFAHTAVVAGCGGNAAALAECGQAFGQLVHLLDAVEDLRSDRRAGRFNPLAATGTPEPVARATAERLRSQVTDSLAHVDFVDRALVDVLLGHELHRAVRRAFPREDVSSLVPRQRTAVRSPLAALTAVLLLIPGVFVGGWSSGGCGPRRRSHPHRGYRSAPQYGYHQTGPSCGQLLACNCCANLACNACCCGDSCTDV